MANNDERYIPVATGDDNDVPNLQSLNEIIRRLQMDIYKIEGRLGESVCRDSFRILGGLHFETLTPAPDISEVGEAIIYLDEDGKLKVSENGSAYVDLV